MDLFGHVHESSTGYPKKNGRKTKADKQADLLPEKLGKAIKLPVPDFSDPDRKLTCLEADFPIAACRTNDKEAGRKKTPATLFYVHFCDRQPCQSHSRPKKAQLATLYS